MSNRLVNNAGAKKRAQEIGSAVKGNTISNSRNALDLARSLGGSANGGMASAATGAVKGTTGSMRGAATGAVSGVSSSVTKDPSDVIGTLTGNATVDASPKGGVAASAKGTNFQTAMDQLRNYYRQQIENAKAGISNTVNRAQEGYSGLKSSMEQLRDYYRKQTEKEKADLAYADYLTGGKVSEDIKYGNYLTNGRYSGYSSYEDYLASIGQTPQDSQKTRDASVARANADYARALAGYGQTGEQLARSGLSNTGYSDASNNAAYAAKQNAILQADATKAATDQSNRLGYAQYLQAYDAQQQNKMLTVLEYTTQAGMTEEQAKAYAKAVGFDDTIAESIGKAQAAYTAAKSGTATKATDLYNTLVSNENFAYDPATKNSLRQQLLNSGYDEATVDDVLGRLDKSYTVGQKDSYDLIMKALTDDSVYDQIGSMIDGFYEMNDNDKAVAIDKYVASSNLSYEQKADFFYQKLYQKIMKGETASDVLNELASYQSIGMPKSVYDKVTYNMMGYIALNEDGVPNNFNGKKLSVRAMTNSMVGKEISYLGNEQRGTLKAGNDGKIYKSCGNGRWTVVTKFIIDTIGYEEMEKYSTVIKGRYYDRGAIKARTVQDSVRGLISVTGKGIEITEKLMINKLWTACKLQTSEQLGLAFDSDENCRAAAKLFDKVVTETQSQYVPSMKSSLARHNNVIVRGFTQFKSDGQAMLGSLYDNVRGYFDLKERKKAGQNVDAELKAAKKRAARSIPCIAAVCVGVAIITQGMRYLFNNDDEDDETPVKNIAMNTLNSAMGMFPLVGDVYSVFAEGYDISNMTLDALNDGVNGIKAMTSLIGNDNATKTDVARATRKALYGVGHMAGVPVRNLTNLTTGVIRRFNKPAMYGYDSIFSGEKYSEDLKKAVKYGDDKMAEAITKVMFRRKKTGAYNQETLDEVLRLYKAGYDKKVMPGGIPDGLTRAQRKTFLNVYGKSDADVQKLIESDAYKAFDDEQKASAISSLYRSWRAYAEYQATGETDDKSALLSEIMGADKFGKARAYLSGLKAKENAETPKDGWRSTIQKGLKGMGLTSDEQALMLYAAGYHSTSDLSAFLRVLNARNLTKEQLALFAAIFKLDVKNGKLVERKTTKKTA